MGTARTGAARFPESPGARARLGVAALALFLYGFAASARSSGLLISIVLIVVGLVPALFELRAQRDGGPSVLGGGDPQLGLVKEVSS